MNSAVSKAAVRELNLPLNAASPRLCETFPPSLSIAAFECISSKAVKPTPLHRSEGFLTGEQICVALSERSCTSAVTSPSSWERQ